MDDFITHMYSNKNIDLIELTPDKNEYKDIISKLTHEIININQELHKYKTFHDAILENQAIKKKFLMSQLYQNSRK